MRASRYYGYVNPNRNLVFATKQVYYLFCTYPVIVFAFIFRVKAEFGQVISKWTVV